MKYLVLILHMISGDQFEIRSPRMAAHLVNMLNTASSNQVWTQQGIFISHNNHEVWINLNHIESVEKIFKLS